MGAVGEGWEFEDACWSVPEDGGGFLDFCVEELSCVFSDVHSHHGGGYVGCWDGGWLCVGGEVVGDDEVGWEEEFGVLFFCLCEALLCEGDHVGFDE